ncbi:MAG: hypothetical protein OFPII_43470 [Osedax symbiont Rs1]|nr:MAG: hypothetical protein OFPII_43470 [Osedax symbiont Rs1]
MYDDDDKIFITQIGLGVIVFLILIGFIANALEVDFLVMGEFIGKSILILFVAGLCWQTPFRACSWYVFGLGIWYSIFPLLDFYGKVPEGSFSPIPPEWYTAFSFKISGFIVIFILIIIIRKLYLAKNY